jgi:acetyl esterase/lipase
VILAVVIVNGSRSPNTSGGGGAPANVSEARPSSQAASGGGVDNGRPGSRCVPRTQRMTAPAEAGTRGGTFNGDYYELGEPTGPAAHAPLMFIVHGGSWVGDGPGQVQSMRKEADLWRHRGWRTLNLDYHACARSFADVLAFYDHFHRLAAGRSICVEGFSAGGHLALMLAAERPEIRCVMGFAAPTDLPAFANERTSVASTRITGVARTAGPRYAYNLAVAAFGRDRLEALSPALHARQITARVLLATAENDIYIPWAQAREFAARHPGSTQTLLLPVGRLGFVHGTTTARGMAQVAQAERRLIAGLR